MFSTNLDFVGKTNAEQKKSRFPGKRSCVFDFIQMEGQIVQYVASLGLDPTIAVTIGYRAGKLRGLTPENVYPKLDKLANETLSSLVTNKLQEVFNLHFNTPEGINWKAARYTMTDLASALPGSDTLLGMQGIYFDLINLGTASFPFGHALTMATLGG
jgi:hypothetical protein